MCHLCLQASFPGDNSETALIKVLKCVWKKRVQKNNTGVALKKGKYNRVNKQSAVVSHLSVDWHIAVAQREARGGSGGYRRS